MKDYLQGIDQAFWITNEIAVVLFFSLLIRLRVTRSLPRYVLFIGFKVVKGACLIAIAEFLPYAVYFWGFYALQAIEAPLLMIVLYEIFHGTFAPLDDLPSRTIANLLTGLAAVTTVALAAAISTAHGHPGFPWYANLLSMLNRSAGIVAACSLWSVVMYARRIGVHWQSRTAEIARGFLFYLSVQAVITWGTGFTRPAGTMWLNRVTMLAYLGTLIMWLRGIRREAPAVQLPSPAALGKLQIAAADLRTAVTALSTHAPAARAE